MATVALANTSIKSHNHHFVCWWEHWRPPLSAALNCIIPCGWLESQCGISLILSAFLLFILLVQAVCSFLAWTIVMASISPLPLSMSSSMLLPGWSKMYIWSLICNGQDSSLLITTVNIHCGMDNKRTGMKKRMRQPRDPLEQGWGTFFCRRPFEYL